jgi:hypothetical protein
MITSAPPASVAAATITDDEEEGIPTAHNEARFDVLDNETVIEELLSPTEADFDAQDTDEVEETDTDGPPDATDTEEPTDTEPAEFEAATETGEAAPTPTGDGEERAPPELGEARFDELDNEPFVEELGASSPPEVVGAGVEPGVARSKLTYISKLPKIQVGKPGHEPDLSCRKWGCTCNVCNRWLQIINALLFEAEAPAVRSRKSLQSTVFEVPVGTFSLI